MALPQVNALLEKPELRDLERRFSHELIKKFCQEVIAEKRQEILGGSGEGVDDQNLIQQVQDKLRAFLQPRLPRVINCTGILLHTGLGRAPLLDEAYERAFQRVRSACDLELDLETGERGDRQIKLDDLLCFLTGAEVSAVVNNARLSKGSYRRSRTVDRDRGILPPA
jgi:L-seryl-tRNA(Ser) seleniumtransferase